MIAALPANLQDVAGRSATEEEQARRISLCVWAEFIKLRSKLPVETAACGCFVAKNVLITPSRLQEPNSVVGCQELAYVFDQLQAFLLEKEMAVRDLTNAFVIKNYTRGAACSWCRQVAEVVTVSFPGVAASEAPLCWCCFRRALHLGAQSAEAGHGALALDPFTVDWPISSNEGRGAIALEEKRPRAQLAIKSVGYINVVRFSCKTCLDYAHHEEIANQLFGLVDHQDDPKKVLLDLGNAECLCAAALGKLVMLHKRVRNAGGMLRLCNLSPLVSELFNITRLSQLFDIRKNEATALEDF